MTLIMYIHLLVLFPSLTPSCLAFLNHTSYAPTCGCLHWLPPHTCFTPDTCIANFLTTFLISPSSSRSLLSLDYLPTSLCFINTLHSQCFYYLFNCLLSLPNCEALQGRIYSTPLCTSAPGLARTHVHSINICQIKFLRSNIFFF